MLKVKEVLSRIRQIRDYETAEEQTHAEGMKTFDLAEKQKLGQLIEGFRMSRKNTIIKLISLLQKMVQNGLWLTYVSTEAACEELQTPRKTGNPDKYGHAKRGVRTSVRAEIKPNFDNQRLGTDIAIASENTN